MNKSHVVKLHLELDETSELCPRHDRPVVLRVQLGEPGGPKSAPTAAVCGEACFEEFRASELRPPFVRHFSCSRCMRPARLMPLAPDYRHGLPFCSIACATACVRCGATNARPIAVRVSTESVPLAYQTMHVCSLECWEAHGVEAAADGTHGPIGAPVAR